MQPSNGKKWNMILIEIGMIKMNRTIMMIMKTITLQGTKKNIDKQKNKLKN